MPFPLQWLVNKITFPSPPSSYSLTSHPELFFVKSPKSRPSYPGVPCMLYAIPQGAPVLLVHAHSNGCDIGDMRQTLQSISESLRVHVMSFEFPGYGLHVGSANMRSIDEAASTVLHFIVSELGINIAQVVWYGRSIGSGPAIRIVHKISTELQQQPGGVVLQCGYANFQEVAGHLFGCFAKKLVSPLWPNEVMMKELKCPVLLIHGRADTMIPIEQSEKLWKAVADKELSKFHTCDCGHNDFNFRRCTLRPIYDFLLGVISSPNYPATNFAVELSAASHTFVHHIGPLRSKIPVYSFRRTELEEWMRRLQQRGSGAEVQLPADLSPGQRVAVRGLPELPELNGKAGLLQDYDSQAQCWTVALDDGVRLSVRPEHLAPVLPLAPGQRVVVAGLPGGSGLNGAQGLLQGYDARAGKWRLQVDGAAEAVLLQAEHLQATAGSKAAPGPGEEAGAQAAGQAGPAGPKLDAKGREIQLTSPGGATPQQTPKTPPTGGKRASSEPPPIPDFTELPPIEDVSLALLDPEGMVRTCALRVDAFLERLQRQLDRIDGLESKPLDEVIEFVEAEFWASDPLLCLWEEVSLPHGERVRFRLGPFSIDSTGACSYDRGLGAGSAPGANVLRVPVWIFQPSPAHFRCLSEWSLLHSERLQRHLPAASQSTTGSSCCCVPSKGLKRKRPPRGGRRGESAAHPTRGVLATSLAAHFVNWVEKTDEIKQVFARFVALHNNAEEAFRRLSSAQSASSGPALAPKELPSDLPRSPQSVVEEHEFDEEEVSPPHAAAPSAPEQPAGRALGPRPASRDEEAAVPSTPPQPPWSPPYFSASSRATLRDGIGPFGAGWGGHLPGSFGAGLAELYAQIGMPERCGERRPSAGPNLCDFQATAELVAGPVLPDKNMDWVAASVMLHYERLSSSGKVEAAGEEAWGDPMRPEMRRTGVALNKAIKAFAHAEHRERREQQRQRLRPPRMPPPPPQDPDGAPDPPPAAAQPTAGDVARVAA